MLTASSAFTDTETRILDALADGGRHYPCELERLLPRSRYGRRAALHWHISNIKPKLSPCETIHFVIGNCKPYYILVGLLTPECSDTSDLSYPR